LGELDNDLYISFQRFPAQVLVRCTQTISQMTEDLVERLNNSYATADESIVSLN